MSAKKDQSLFRARGFTLIELLVVIGLLALLLALLLPSFVGARRQARVIQCASNMRQICAGMHAYAMDNKGHFPDLTTPSTGGNLWDVPHFYTAAMKRENVDFRTFLCPAMQEDASAALTSFTTYNYFNIIYYNIWIPRLNGADVIPPGPTTPGRFTLVSPTPTAPFAGPATVNDTARSGNPVITDIVGSSGAVTPPADADPTQGNNPYQITTVSNHLDGQVLRGVNWGFADGHVEFHNGNEVHPYYFGNWWNWR
jgi:prepilin-type N-terminal cleavage/methylation domain-containing protein/prepilin-type processing-associated H-X9-DG protein